MADKHTPGPWQVSGVRSKALISGIEHGVHCIGPDGDPMIYAGYSDRTNALHCECMANARLVAAAPELLQAAIDLLAEVDEMEKRVGWAGYPPWEGQMFKCENCGATLPKNCMCANDKSLTPPAPSPEVVTREEIHAVVLYEYDRWFFSESNDITPTDQIADAIIKQFAGRIISP